MLFDAIERVAARGVGVIYISHRLDEVFKIADRVTVLRDGHRIGTYRVDEIDQAELVSLMVGSVDLRPAKPARALAGKTRLVAARICGETVVDLDLTAAEGEIVGVAGLTGSGREEVLSLIFGARRRSGLVSVDGVTIPADSPRAAVEGGLGFVPPDRHGEGSIPTMNVRENCTVTDLARYSRKNGRIVREAERHEVEAWIDSLDVRPKRSDAPFTSLSGGNQQKIVIAKWLRMAPRALLLDEPTQGVDVGAKGAIHALAREAAVGGAAVVVASSDEIELCDLCDRVLVLRDGEVAGELAGERLTPEEIARLEL